MDRNDAEHQTHPATIRAGLRAQAPGLRAPGSGPFSCVQPEPVIGKDWLRPPIEPARASREVRCAGLALQRRDYLAALITLGVRVACFGDDDRNVSRPAIVHTTSDDEADGADVGFRLQLRERAGLPPAEARTERAE